MHLNLNKPEKTLLKAGYDRPGMGCNFRRHIENSKHKIRWFHAVVQPNGKTISLHMDLAKKSAVKKPKGIYHNHFSVQNGSNVKEELERIKLLDD